MRINIFIDRNISKSQTEEKVYAKDYL